MKVKVISTGQIIEIKGKDTIFIHSEQGPVSYFIDQLEFIDGSKPCDCDNINWERRRFALINSIAKGLIANPNTKNIDYKLINSIFLVTDTIIEKLKEENNESKVRKNW